MVTTNINFDRKAKRGSTIFRAQIDFETADLTTGGTNSGVVDLEGLDGVTFWFEHSSDVAITVKLFDAPDPQFTRGNVHQLGNDISLSAGNTTKQYARETLSQTTQILRINASAAAGLGANRLRMWSQYLPAGGAYQVRNVNTGDGNNSIDTVREWTL